MTRVGLLGGALLLSLAAASAWAEASGPPSATDPAAALPNAVTLADVLTHAKRVSTRLAAERAQVGIAEGQREGAGAYPNPSLGYSNATTVRGANLLGGSQHTAALQVPLRIGGQGGARVRAADAQVEVARDL